MHNWPADLRIIKNISFLYILTGLYILHYYYYRTENTRLGEKRKKKKQEKEQKKLKKGEKRGKKEKKKGEMAWGKMRTNGENTVKNDRHMIQQNSGKKISLDRGWEKNDFDIYLCLRKFYK